MRKKSEEDPENLKESDIIGEVKVTIDKNAFKGPFTCCSRKTKKVTKKTSYAGLGITYWAWKCAKCGKEYLETDQSKKLQKIWTLQMLMEDKAPTMERSLNYDGKTYFVRFPKDLTAGWAKQKKEKARLTMLSPDRYLVEVA